MSKQHRAINIAALVSTVLSGPIQLAPYSADRDSAQRQRTHVSARLESIRANFQESINFKVDLLDSIVELIRARASDSSSDVLGSIFTARRCANAKAIFPC